MNLIINIILLAIIFFLTLCLLISLFPSLFKPIFSLYLNIKYHFRRERLKIKFIPNEYLFYKKYLLSSGVYIIDYQLPNKKWIKDAVLHIDYVPFDIQIIKDGEHIYDIYNKIYNNISYIYFHSEDTNKSYLNLNETITYKNKEYIL